jgi:hypothetical protein
MNTKPYGWTVEKMVTQDRAERVALRLFNAEYHDDDCKNETGREGLPCSICAANNARWIERVAQVRSALISAFR